MKNIFQKLTLAMMPVLLAGCSGLPAATSSSNNPASSSEDATNTSSEVHSHEWSADWEYNETNHWKTCSGCNEKGENAAHTLGEAQTANLGTLIEDSRFNLSTVKYQECTVCGYRKIDGTQSMLPELKFEFTDKDSKGNSQPTDFATSARSTDTTRPKVEGTLKITNAGDEYDNEEGYAKTKFKVRGNQTAGFDKKGFQINLDKKQNLLGLNGGKKFKKWVLLADAKDTTISRTALGLTLCKGVIGEDSKVWSSDFTPVKVYLNNDYWGVYMLAEQKEAKDGRIQLPEPEDADGNPITTTDIGYSFELDYYARNESAKGAEGDPTFSISYGNYFNRNSYNIESCLANSGLGIVSTYTMNSDITDSTASSTQHTDDSNSNQLKFIKARLQALFTVLAEASKNKVAKDIDANNNVINTSLTVEQTIKKNFDLNAWAEGFIINAVCLPPDVGYSSFYMSYDNTPNGDHKLRYDNPWDFDSNFGNRRNFIVNPDQKNGNYDPYFMDRSANMWLQFLGKLDFFMNDYVKPKWEAAKERHTFENMISYATAFYTYFDAEHQRNFQKWTTTQASDNNVGSYFNGDGVNSGELRKPFVNVNERKEAQKETLSWITRRVAYLDGKWGSNNAQ